MEIRKNSTWRFKGSRQLHYVLECAPRVITWSDPQTQCFSFLGTKEEFLEQFEPVDEQQ